MTKVRCDGKTSSVDTHRMKRLTEKARGMSLMNSIVLQMKTKASEPKPGSETLMVIVGHGYKEHPKASGPKTWRI